MKKIKILMAMSGGVDSSVAAALLLEQGYDVTGAFMVNYDENGCWRGDYQDALRVAAKLGIKLLRLNFTKEYKKLVLDYMFKEYKAGRTPNPDVMCNKFIKFGVWLKKAKELGFDKLATGHYARLRSAAPGQASTILLQAKDENKDQTYFLHQLTQKQLQHVLFPLGDYTKPEVRKLAKKFNLPVADKEESMGICFIGEVLMKEFLQTRIKLKPGNIIFDNKIIGKHDGLAFYTIGQRIGIKNMNTKPVFVVDKDMKNNKLVIGHENDPKLYKKEIVVRAYGNTPVHWISGHSPKFPLKCMVRLRHRQPMRMCVVSVRTGLDLSVQFAKSQRAATPGQFAVFYLPRGKALRGKIECLGGGEIT